MNRGPPRPHLDSFTKDRMKARDSVNSLVLRYPLMSLAKVAMVSVLSRNCRRQRHAP